MSDIEGKIEKTLAKIEKLELEVLELKKENEKSKGSVAECDLLFKKILRDMSFNYELSIREMSIFKYIIKEIFFNIKNFFDKGQKNEINVYNFSMEINIKRFFLNEKFNFIKIKNILENILNSCNVIIDYENTLFDIFFFLLCVLIFSVVYKSIKERCLSNIKLAEHNRKALTNYKRETESYLFEVENEFNKMQKEILNKRFDNLKELINNFYKIKYKV